jgi:hypothetical protein
VSVEEIANSILFAVLAALGIWRLPRAWRNEIGLHSDTPHPWWLWGERLWRAVVRTAPVGAAMFVLAAPLYPLELLITQEILHGVIVTLIALGSLPIFVGGLTVILFNRPKRFVAPHHRHQRGLVAELLGRRSAPTPPPESVPSWQGHSPGGSAA